MSKQEDDLNKAAKGIDFLAKLGIVAFVVGFFVVIAVGGYLIILFLAWLWMVLTV